MELFQPSLSLILQRNGRYTLRSVTLTPNSCFYAGRAEIGVPPNVRVLPEVLPVLLPIQRREGPICLQVITPVHHQLRNLELGPEFGKSSVTAFVMLDGMVVGSASIPVTEPAVELETKGEDKGEKPGRETVACPYDTRDWYAWVNLMPPGPPSFHVVGSVLAPTPGYEARLRPAEPQGINPSQLILEVELVPLPGVWPDVLTWISARYDQKDYDAAYTEVAIRCGGAIYAVTPVEEVH